MSSMISGADLIFETARRGFDVRSLLDAVLEVWPDGLLQDADGEEVRPLLTALSEVRADCHEFFLYMSQASADSWLKEGWTEQHSNEMFHFLIADDAARPDILQLTIVIGSATSETLRFAAAIFDALGRMATGKSAPHKPSSRIDWEADLRTVGYTLGKDRFYEKVEELSNAMFSEWTADELACHPHEAQQFCEVVRRTVARVPDHLVMKALLNRRKQKQSKLASFAPRLLWGG